MAKSTRKGPTKSKQTRSRQGNKSTARKFGGAPARKTEATAETPAALKLRLTLHGLVTPDVYALEAAKGHAVALAEAESLAIAGVFAMVTARSNRLNKPPVCYHQLSNGAWIVCLLQSDGSYGQCRPYTGPVPGPVCG